MTAFFDSAKAIISRFDTQWTAAHPAFPIIHDNQHYEPVEGSDFVYLSVQFRGMRRIDVVGEFGDHWNLDSPYPASVTGNQNSTTVKTLVRNIENGPVPIRQQHRDTGNFSAQGILSKKVYFTGR